MLKVLLDGLDPALPSSKDAALSREGEEVVFPSPLSWPDPAHDNVSLKRPMQVSRSTELPDAPNEAGSHQVYWVALCLLPSGGGILWQPSHCWWLELTPR